jgi:hypothetical protein
MYITLEAAFDVINKYVIPKDGSGFKLMELSTETEGYTGATEDLLCIAHPIQVSVDPTICIIKRPDGINHTLFFTLPGKTNIKMVKIAITAIPLQGLPIHTGCAPSTPIICIFKSSLEA